MILDPHTESIDQDGDHDPTSKVLAVNDLPKRIAHQPPEVHHLPGRFPQPERLFPGLPTVPPVPAARLVDPPLAVGVSRRLCAALRLIGEGFGAIRATFRVHWQPRHVHGAARGAEVTGRQLASGLGCS